MFWVLTPLPDVYFPQVLSHSIGCLIILLIVSLLCRSFYIWCRTICWFLLLVFMLLVSYLEKLLPRPALRSFFPTFSSMSFMVLGLIFKACIYFKLILVGGVTWGFIFIVLHVFIQFLQHYWLETAFSPWVSLTSLSNISWLYMWSFISGLSVLFYWSRCVFLCQCHAVLLL